MDLMTRSSPCLVLLVVSVGLLVAGVQTQPTTIIPAHEAVATLANTTWKSNADFLHEVRQIPEITKVNQAGLVKLCSVEHISITSMRRWPHGSGAELADQQWICASQFPQP